MNLKELEEVNELLRYRGELASSIADFDISRFHPVNVDFESLSGMSQHLYKFENENIANIVRKYDVEIGEEIYNELKKELESVEKKISDQYKVDVDMIHEHVPELKFQKFKYWSSGQRDNTKAHKSMTKGLFRVSSTIKSQEALGEFKKKLKETIQGYE